MPADSAAYYQAPEREWGIATGIRNAQIPCPAEESRVNNIIPLMFNDSDIFFIRGLTGGAKLYNEDRWQFSLVGRYRYFDIPAEFQNMVQGDAHDVGGEQKYRVNKQLDASLEIVNNDFGRYYSTLNSRYRWESGSWELLPYVTLRFKSADFNDHYFGLDGFTDPDNPADTIDNRIGSGIDLTLGGDIRYHVISNLYIIGRAQITD